MSSERPTFMRDAPPQRFEAAPDDTELDLRAIAGLLRRQMRLIFLVLFAVVGVAAIAVFSLTPIYSASTLVLVDPSEKNLLSDETRAVSSADSARVDSEVEILRSDAVLLQVIRNLNLVEDEEFGARLGWRDRLMSWLQMSDGAGPDGEEAVQQVLGRLSSATSVNRRGLTYLINVSARSEDPGKAAIIANELSSAYIRDQVNSKIESTLATRDILQGRLDSASESVEGSEEQLDTFVFNNIERIEGGTGRSDLSLLSTRLETLDQERLQIQELAELVDQNLTGRDWATLTSALESDAIAELERQRQELEARLQEEAPGAAEAVDLRQELAALEQRMETAAAGQLSELRGEVTAAQAEADDLRRQITTSALSRDLPPDVATEMYGLQQNAQIARQQYQTLLQRLREVEAQASLQVADSRIVSEALSPNRPSFPNTPLFLALAGLMGLGLGVGLAFLNEHYVGGFTNEGQVQSVLHVPVISTLPKLKSVGKSDVNHGDAQPSDALMVAPLSAYSESVRRVRAGVDQILRRRREVSPEAKPRGVIVMVTSALPAEGKTTLALSLARTYAMSGHQTLLIDGDMRKPSVHRQLGVEPSAGLLEYLADTKGENTLSGILSREEETGLEVLVGARQSRVPTDQLLTGKRFEQLVKSAANHFEVVVLDTPPVGPVVDGMYLAQHADVVALVIRWASTAQSEVRKALDRIDQGRARSTEVVAVLNQSEDDAKRYSGKYADYYNEAY